MDRASASLLPDLALWRPPPARLTLPNDEVHVWRVGLDPPLERVDELARSLSTDERRRADRFVFEHLGRRFVVARGSLRAILASYTGLAPEQLEFHYGPQGKPSLAARPGGVDLHFNISHSHDLAIYALARGREVGIDLEWLGRPVAEPEQIAERFFSAAERAALRTLPEPLRIVGFYNCWTRKEAFIKALGDGLTYPLDAFDVSLAPGAPAALLACRQNGGGVDRWEIQALDVGPEYCAALVVERGCRRICLWER